MSKIIESRTVERDYGFTGTEAIIEHYAHGRLLICDGFGGVDQLRGGSVRWEHGAVYKLQPGDTFSYLDRDWNPGCSHMSALTNGYDESRPVLDWDGAAIASVAKAAGL